MFRTPKSTVNTISKPKLYHKIKQRKAASHIYANLELLTNQLLSCKPNKLYTVNIK